MQFFERFETTTCFLLTNHFLRLERESYDNIIAEKYNKKFFEQLKKVGPYYKREIWEEDYQRQVNTIFFCL